MKWNPAAGLKNIGYGWIGAGVSKGKFAIQVANRLPWRHLTVSFAVSDLAEREQLTSSNGESDADGHWILDQLPAVGELELTIEHPDFALLRTNLAVSEARSAQPILVLQPGVSVTGVVDDDKGGPICGATVVDDDTKAQPSRELSASTTSDGLFFFPLCQPWQALAPGEGGTL